jgi:hypothetical protein
MGTAIGVVGWLAMEDVHVNPIHLNVNTYPLSRDFRGLTIRR